jgi:hypothetical protein
MRKYIYIYYIAALVLSCESNEQTSLSVDYTPAPLAAAGDETSFTVRASGKWSASKTTSWVTLSPASGTGAQTVTVTVRSNENETQNTPARVAKIYILSGAHTETLTITQSGGTHPVPSAPVITGTGITSCEMELKTTPVDYAVSYTWYKDDMAISGVTTASYTAIESGVYTVAGVNVAGEMGEPSAGYAVTIVPCPPETAGAIEGADANSCSAGVSTLTADNTVTLSIDIKYATSYAWYYHSESGEVMMQTGPSRSYTAYISGSYTVEGFNSSGTSTRSPVKTVNITPCFTFAYGGDYNRMECEKAVLNTAGGESLVEPFLSIYNAGGAAFNANNPPREFVSCEVELGASSTAEIIPGYSNAGYIYGAYASCIINKAADDTYTFTNLAGTSNYLKPFADNMLSFFLHSGTACVGAAESCVNVPPSGNRFRIGLAPNHTPGLTKPIIAFYVVSDPRIYFPGVL